MRWLKNLFLSFFQKITYPAGNYMFKVKNRNTRTKCKICSKLTIKTPERRRTLSNIYDETFCENSSGLLVVIYFQKLFHRRCLAGYWYGGGLMTLWSYLIYIYLLKCNNRNTRTMCEIYSKLTMKAPERRQDLYMIHHNLDLFYNIYNTVTEHNRRQTHYLSSVLNYFGIYF